jgi:hypothetical protein
MSQSSSTTSTNEQEIRNILLQWAKATREGRQDEVLANHLPDALIYDVLPPHEIRRHRGLPRKLGRMAARRRRRGPLRATGPHHNGDRRPGLRTLLHQMWRHNAERQNLRRFSPRNLLPRKIHWLMEDRTSTHLQAIRAQKHESVTLRPPRIL